MAGAQADRMNLTAGIASVSVAATLVLIKLWALGTTGALSVAASLADSGLDLVMSLGGLMAILYAARPADEDHAFGHTSVEDLTALTQSLFITLSGVAIGWSAIRRLLNPGVTKIGGEAGGMVVMVASIVITLALVLWQRHVAGRTGNKVVAADSLHYISDLLPNIGALVALAVSRAFGIGQIDSLVALLAAGIMLFGALRIGRSAWDALMDRQADPALIADLEAIIRAWPGVKGFHDLKTRMAGSRVFVHLHIELDGDQTLREAHAIGAGLRRKIIESHPNCDVIIHKDVAGER